MKDISKKICFFSLSFYPSFISYLFVIIFYFDPGLLKAKRQQSYSILLQNIAQMKQIYRFNAFFCFFFFSKIR